MGPEVHCQRSRRQLSAGLPWNFIHSHASWSDAMNAVELSEPVNAILLDIEGTTTPIDFVYQTLFPYAREHVNAYLDQHFSEADVQADLAGLLAENAADL